MVEIGIVLSLLTIFVVALLPLGVAAIRSAKEARIDNDLKTVALACQQYYKVQGHWPSQVSDLQSFHMNQLHFLNSNFNVSNYTLGVQSHILTISLGTNSIIVLKTVRSTKIVITSATNK